MTRTKAYQELLEIKDTKLEEVADVLQAGELIADSKVAVKMHGVARKRIEHGGRRMKFAQRVRLSQARVRTAAMADADDEGRKCY